MITLEILIALPDYKVGDTITLETKSGVIKDQYWRNRLKDSAIDGCVKIVEEEE